MRSEDGEGQTCCPPFRRACYRCSAAVLSTTVPPTTSPATKAAQPVVDEVELSLSELRAQAALQSAESQGAAIVLTLGKDMLTCDVSDQKGMGAGVFCLFLDEGRWRYVSYDF